MPDLLGLHEELARVTLTDRGLGDVLGEITGIARRAMPETDAASITLIRGDTPSTAAYDGQMALDADELQYERGYGPCLDAGRSGEVLLIDDMRTEQRWPDYTRNAAQRGIGSSLSVPLPFQGSSIGGLNTYAAHPHAFGEDDRVLGEEVASWIALAVSKAQVVSATSEELGQLREAMVSRAVIEQAKGRLMERYGLTADRAFALLTRSSQTSNVKLRDVAAQLVETGFLAGTPGSPSRGRD